MPFYYLRCGECCSAMGDIHALEGDPVTGRCVVFNRYTGERTSVAVDPDKIDLLDLPAIPGSCPTPFGFSVLQGNPDTPPPTGVSCTQRVVQQMTEIASPPSYPAPAGLLFDRMLRSDRVVPLAHPLPVEVAVDDGSCVLSSEEFDLLVVAPTRTGAIEGWYYELRDAARIRFYPSVGVPGIGTGL